MRVKILNGIFLNIIDKNMTEFEYFSKSNEEKAIINSIVKESIDIGLTYGNIKIVNMVKILK